MQVVVRDPPAPLHHTHEKVKGVEPVHHNDDVMGTQH